MPDTTTGWRLGTTNAPGIAAIGAAVTAGAVRLCPTGGVDRSLSIVGGVHETPTGAKTRDVMGRKRAWKLAFSGLPDSSPIVEQPGREPGVLELEHFVTGTRGVGPFYFWDPILAPTATTANYSLVLVDIEVVSVMNFVSDVVMTVTEA